MTACCGKCGSTNVSWGTKTLNGTAGMIVYCGGCGAIFNWVPKI